jgi:beta-glucosidase
MSSVPRFPNGFLWGASTSAYQIEGAVAQDGRGPSIWDTFCHSQGRTKDGDTGDIAADHYHRWAEDVRLLADLGANAYRFSVAWPRVQPSGSGPVNTPGLDFYDRLVDGLAERGITALPTLYHWDLPQALEDCGGWLNRETAYRFGDYAALVADRLGDRVTSWITLNEPFVHMAFGYALGLHAPGRTLGVGALPVAHHQLLAHGLAAAQLRDRGLGVLIANNCTPVRPASEAEEDVAAAAAYDVLHNRLFNDPVLLGRYPDLSILGVPADPPFVQDGDLDLIAAPLEALGVNYYNPTVVGFAGNSPSEPILLDGLPFALHPIEGVPVTAFGWPVVPSGLTDLLVGLRAQYGDALPPIYITENGCSTHDTVTEDDDAGTPRVHDPARIDFLTAHLEALHAAMDAGVDVRGYLTWSLIDNFEWAEGYSQRFGLVRVDFETQRRIPKDSYHWLRDVLAAQR